MEWFNSVDATYRSDVRAIADAQSARIDARMGQVGTMGTVLALLKL